MTPTRRASAVLFALFASLLAPAQTPTNDECTQPVQLVPGLNPPNGDFYGLAATPSATTDGCGPWYDLWFSYFAPNSGPVSFSSAASVGGANGYCRMEVFDACGGSIIGGHSPCLSGFASADVDMFAGQTCLVRVVPVLAVTLPAAFRIHVYAPANKMLGGYSVDVADGVNPRPPLGSPTYEYTDIGGANFGYPSCTSADHAVSFTYVATATGVATASTCTPPGLAAGTIVDSVVWIYHYNGAWSLVGCNDDTCGLLSAATFPCVAGDEYMIIVGSYVGTAQGTFRLTITPPAPNNDDCSGAAIMPNGVGARIDGSTFGATPTPATPMNCIAPGADDVYFTWVAYATQACVIRLESQPGLSPFVGADHVSVRAGDSCANSAGTSGGGCGTSVSMTVISGTTYLIRVANTGAVPHGPFTLVLDAPPPANDELAGTIPLVSGMNPAGGVGGYSASGATESPGIGACVAFTRDVFFSYVAPTTGTIDVFATAPQGVGVIFSTFVLEAHPAGAEAFPPIACAVTTFNFNYLSFQAAAGQAFTLRVATLPYSEDFSIRVLPRLELKLSSPLGVSSLQIQDLGGSHDAVYINLFTLYPGGFPNGPWFGIDLTLTELMLQISSGQAPFVGLLNAQGAATFGPVIGLPPLTLYGVALELDASGFIVRTSAPVAYTVL